ncbi:MAG: molybdate ABC transporter substrate-binding protein [Rhodospirillales bacterium]|nr:molybdate ABC transporter substrate-binding protein [Rhodospirillales bacterium]
MLCLLRKIALTTIVALTAFGNIGSLANARDITVFAAASLTDAIQTAATAYEHETGDHVLLSLASSSTLARQIAAGAPADIYISANQKWMSWLEDQNLIVSGSRNNLLSNSLVLIAPADSPITPIDITTSTELTSMIEPKDRIAIGDPDHVPAGIYAKQALTSLGQWDVVNPRLARADNVRAALALVERGEAPLGIVYRTDAEISQAVKIIGTFPKNSHPAITYPIALIGNQKSHAAGKMLLWLLGEEAGKIFSDYGFDPIAYTQAGTFTK